MRDRFLLKSARTHEIPDAPPVTTMRDLLFCGDASLFPQSSLCSTVLENLLENASPYVFRTCRPLVIMTGAISMMVNADSFYDRPLHRVLLRLQLCPLDFTHPIQVQSGSDRIG